MDYREQLYQAIEKYFMDIAVSYGPVNEEAMQLVKKFRPFQKKSYGQYIEKYPPDCRRGRRNFYRAYSDSNG